MAFGGIVKMPTFGTPSLPQNPFKRHHSQGDRNDRAKIPRIVKTPPLNGDYSETRRPTTLDAYSSDSRNAAFQGHDQNGLADSDSEDGEHESATPAEVVIIEISDDEDLSGSNSEHEHESTEVNSADAGTDVKLAATILPRHAAIDGNNEASHRYSLRSGATQDPENSNSDLNSDLQSGMTPAKLKQTKEVPDKRGATVEYMSTLEELASKIPPRFLVSSGGSRKFKVWIGALRYVRHLNGTRVARKVEKMHYCPENGILFIRKALFDYVKGWCTFEMEGKGKRKGEIRNTPENISLLAGALVAYFDQNRSGVDNLRSKMAAEDAGGYDSKGKATSVTSGATSTRPITAIAAPTNIDPRAHEEASHYIRELSVSGPPPLIPRALLAQGPQEYFIRDLPIEQASSGTTDAPKRSTDADNKPEPEQKQIELGLPLDSGQRSTTASSSVKREPVSESEASTNSMEMTGGDGIREPEIVGSVKVEATTGGATGSEVVEKSVKTLQTAVKKALKKNVDWNNVPVALFECEMALKRVQTALDKAKEVFAKHGDQMETD